LTVEEIEKILGSKLPSWAFGRADGFWGNSGMREHTQMRCWLLQGFKAGKHTVSDKNRSGSVTFRRKK
jgi:hypothetical protein